MNIAPEEERFADNTVIMAQAVHEGVTKLYNAGYQTVSPGTVELVITIISAFDKHYLIQGFIETSHKICWDAIKRRDEEYVVANAGDIFQYLPADKVNLFKDLFTMKDASGKSVVSDSLKEQLWDLFDAMIKISIKYIHKSRSPYSYLCDGEIRNAYGVSFFDDVDMAHHVDVWGLKLDFPARI